MKYPYGMTEEAYKTLRKEEKNAYVFASSIATILDKVELDPHKLNFLNEEARQDFLKIDLMKHRGHIFTRLTEGDREHRIIEALKVLIIMATALEYERNKEL